jgi:hypothetical protein
MPSRSFALEPGGPIRLTVSWKGSWKNVCVELDGRSVLAIATAKELKEGREVRLEPGTLAIRLNQSVFGPALLLSLNGRPLPKSGGDRSTRLAIAYNTIYFVGGFSIVAGLLTEVFAVPFLKEVGFGWPTVAEGLVFAVLALWVQKRHSLVGLALAVGLFGLDAVLSISWVLSRPGVAPPIGPVIVKILLLVYMARGLGAIRDLRRETPRTTAGAAPVRPGAG